jgi:hypothetical protein
LTVAERRKLRGRETQLAFEALAIEGGLLSADWLARVAQQNAGGQSDAEYRVPKGIQLRDDIGRYWRIAQAYWADLAKGRAAEGDPRALAEAFVHGLLRECLGFVTLEKVAPTVLHDRTYPVGAIALDGHVPVVVAPVGAGLDAPLSAFGDGTRKRSAFGLAQEFLNARDDAMWGIASDALTLRILRDNASLTRPAWIEADLGRIFTEERFADFAALWLLAHETRFGAKDRSASDCTLEAWRSAGREEGTRAREQLRGGVEDALLALGGNFLAHNENGAIRAALESGALTKEALFQELLRLVYRIIFLLTAEERGVLHDPAATEGAKKLYIEGYGMRRLRDRAARRNAYDRFGDLWEALKIVLRGLSRGEARLGLPALGGLFDASQCPTLDAAKLENRALLFAVFRLSWLREDESLSRVNWRDMGPEELGSVYESLLELVPQITEGGRKLSFAAGAETKGNARKTTGSYYTPDSLVQVLLDSALEPVVETRIAAHPDAPVEALLELSIVDPACGSGHFLLSAARRLAAHVARLESNGTPSADQYRQALRRVVGRCLFGVDLNPMAVELCKVSLWMEAVEPGRPLSFLDAHIQLGNALLGTTPELMAKGIPDAAWEPIAGDDKKIASALKKQNKQESKELSLDFSRPPASTYARLGAGARAVDEEDDATLTSLEAKARHWKELVASAAFEHQRFVADAWCAAFVWRKEPGPMREAAPTNGVFKALERDGARASPALCEEIERLREKYSWFHWPLRFPQVFAKGGFDVVLGNPPWDSLLFREEEFFAGPRPDIAEAPTAAARKKLVAKLETEAPVLFSAYSAALRKMDGVNAFVRSGVRYPLCGVGRVNLFALFAEAACSLVSRRGRIGQILPSGIVSDDSTKMFFQRVVEQRHLVSFFDFENREGIFGAVHRSFKFGILTLTGERGVHADAEFAFFATHVDHLKDPERRFTLSTDDIALLNPVTRTCPIFRSRRDAVITRSVYKRVPVLTASGWKLDLRRLLNSADDSGGFQNNSGEGRLPLYEGKYFHHYEHRWVTNEGDRDRSLTEAERHDPACSIRPRHWYPAEDACARFGIGWKHPWVLAWRDIARSTDERTFIAAVVPSLAIPDTAKVIFAAENQVRLLPALIANIGTFAFDFVARQKVGGTHMSAFIVEQLPLLGPDAYDAAPIWSHETSFFDFIMRRVLELTYTAWDLEPFARDVGYDGPSFRWDPARRFLLRSELDAAFFHLYGLSREDTNYVMDTFPIVRKNDEKAHGEYRTKRVILEIYDAMSEATHTGVSYATRLEPPPADSRVGHAPRARSGSPS